MIIATLGSVLVMSQLGTARSESHECGGLAATVVGTEAAEELRGTDGADVIVGLGGNDRIVGGGGDDVICGGEGDDSVWAGGGNDLIFGGPGTDVLSGDAGTDTCDVMGGTATGCEVLEEAKPIDDAPPATAVETTVITETTLAPDAPQCEGLAATIVGTAGSDVLRGTPEADVIVALEGNDRIIAGGGADVVCAGPGNDAIWGGGGADRLIGGEGVDAISGDEGIDACSTEDDQNVTGCEIDVVSGADISGDIPIETDDMIDIAWTKETPTADTTGVPAGTRLIEHDGDIEVTVRGTVIEDRDIRGCVRVVADDVIIRRSRITCNKGDAALWQGSSFGGLTVEDSTIRGIGDMAGSGIYSQAPMSVIRTEISNVVDGIFVYNDARIEDSWIHDLRTVGTSHNDLIQMVEGNRVVIRNNLLEHTKGQTSAIMIKSDFGPIDDVVIDRNVLSGGSFTVYVYAGSALGGCCGPPTNVRVTNNIVRADSFLYGAMSIQGDTEVRCNTDEAGNPITYFADHRMREPKISDC